MTQTLDCVPEWCSDILPGSEWCLHFGPDRTSSKWVWPSSITMAIRHCLSTLSSLYLSYIRSSFPNLHLWLLMRSIEVIQTALHQWTRPRFKCNLLSVYSMPFGTLTPHPVIRLQLIITNRGVYSDVEQPRVRQSVALNKKFYKKVSLTPRLP